MSTGFTWDISPQFGALLVFPEVSNSSCLIDYSCFQFTRVKSNHLIIQDCSEGYLDLKVEYLPIIFPLEDKKETQVLPAKKVIVSSTSANS